ncbi:MAG: phosphoribosylamine--glycine ligase [Bacteroidia bacterium]
MKVLIVGQGAREHALAWSAHKSPNIEVFCAPGNRGTAYLAQNLPVSPTDFYALRQAITHHGITYVICGGEVPLAKGLADYLKGIATVVGPVQKAARLESSKAWAKGFMQRHGIPTSDFQLFERTEPQKALDFLSKTSYPKVLKVDGLAAGKGVQVVYSYQEAQLFLRKIWEENTFGSASDILVVEDFLTGVERSVFIFTDGKGYVLLPSAKDYKRLGENDTGPNTGGMGAYAPAESPTWIQKVQQQIIEPTLEGLKKENLTYHGFLYFGLMKVDDNPYVLEYNVRLGDPEAQVILPLIENDMEELLFYYGIQKLDHVKVRWHAKASVGVVAASRGYPDAPEDQKPITLPDEIEPDTYIFLAGVPDLLPLRTQGGRICTAVGLGDTLESARRKAYALIEKIAFEGMYYRKDIAQDVYLPG